MIYHIVVGDAAAVPLHEAIMSEPALQGEVIVLKDLLHVGPLNKEEGQSFSALRSTFWQQVAPSEKAPIQVDDMERVLEVSNEMSKYPERQAWFWMAPWPADVSAYHWLLPLLGKHAGRMYVVNIAGLPFLDENGKVHFPKNISEILPKELIKARKLARQVTSGEIEVDTDEWQKLTQDNSGIRRHDGGKKLASQADDLYDAQLASFCSHQFQKASRIVNQALSKFNIPTGDVYLGWRLKKLAEKGTLQLQGDTGKTLKDFDVRLPEAPPAN
ncbi:MAG: DUF1835 domain-containing protein [Taibaiella sp.]|nr:DUF1835 domain-containing protein [Taibaiella sp.]